MKTASRTRYLVAGILVVLAGIGSRVWHRGVPLIDTYLGDALYAVLVYILLSIARLNARPAGKAILAGGIMLAIETFQLTQIPARLAKTGNLMLKGIAFGLGTSFSWYDLVAYACGILASYLLDRWLGEK